MPSAQCYYTILGVCQEATGDDIKKAYRNLALVWHPDKNPTEEAHAKFQTILKAYETLSDSKERDWYDRHKDQILSGHDEGTVDRYMDLFPYFSAACYANFDDSEDGFYTVYRTVFEKIAQEEKTYSVKKTTTNAKNQRDEVVEEYPTFGDSSSTYDEVVRRFYSFWSGFCTTLTFDHLDKYKTTEAENRRIFRAMEKENKKLREPARKERNERIRALVEFIKKRDRRFKAHKERVEKQNELNRQKTSEKQRQQRERFRQTTAEYEPSRAFDNMDELEDQLRKIEAEYESHDEED